MVFNDTTNKDGILQVYERKTDLGYATVTGDTTLLAEATSIANEKNHEVWHNIFMSTGNWQYDDNNNLDLPISTSNLVSGTDSYALPSDALTVQRVECKDENDQWYTLTPITKEEIGSGLDEFMDTDGQPKYYSLINGVVQIYPASNYASTNGLKIYFDRDSVDFATDDTTKTPGFASPYHEILPIMMAIEWYKVKQPASNTLAILVQDQLKLEKAIKEFYGKRFKNFKPKVGRVLRSYK